MKKSGFGQVAARYVSALFDIATEKKAIEAVEKDLLDLAKALQTDAGFADVLANPLLGRAQQQKLVAALADSFAAHAVTKAFLVTLAGQKRLEIIAEAASQFSKMAENMRGEMTADLITAVPISVSETAQVAEHLGKAYGKKTKLRSHQDARLLGGVVVKIGGMQLDASIAGKLQRIEQTLKAA